MVTRDLQRRFGIPGVVRIDEGKGSLPRITVTSELASAELYLHGAHLTHFQPRDARPLLFMSAESHFDATRPIRGGIPVVFPWFGPKAGAPDAPAHGFARIRSWTLDSCEALADGTVRVALVLASDEASLRLWPHPFTLRMIFTVGRSLGLDLEVRGVGSPLTFEEAFHTYFLVGDVRQVRVDGLENTEYLDKVDSFRKKMQPPEPIRISGETDRVYLNTRAAGVIHDPVFGRTITVEKEDSATTVVWNPWIDKARAMPDFGDDEWPGMICVETANVGEAAVRLGADSTHRLRALIRMNG
jgi:glucose-6-phosphate 1-epimerase